MQPEHEPQTPRGSATKRWLGVAFIGFVFITILTGVMVFRFARSAAASWELAQSPGGAVQATPGAGNSAGAPGAIPTGDLSGAPGVSTPTVGVPLPTPDPWNGATRVTVLVMGLDYGDWASEDRQGPPRTDTMILFTVDPVTKTAGFLSIPRDLWVNIPGMGYSKINVANRFGELYKVPGGGPGLAMKTVEQFLGVPINFYAQIDFYAFEKFIDDIGGIDVNVPAEIKVDPIGPHNTVTLPPGINHLDGATALGYARNRYTANDDYDRSQRQHQVIYAIRDRILRLDMLPTLVLKSPQLFQELSGGVHTNMTLKQVVQLAWLAQSIPQENIKNAVIGPNQLVAAKSPEGWDIYKPITAKIRELRDEIFGSGQGSAPSASLSPEERMQAEQARLTVVDAMGNPDLAKRTRDYLVPLGLNVQETITATQLKPATQIIDHTGKPYTVEYLGKLLGLQVGAFTSHYETGNPVDIEIVLGKDWVTNNTLPKQ